jgi:hypothetical protein
MVADIVLTPEDALAREQHRDDSALPPLSPDSVARIAAMGNVADVFTKHFRKGKNVVAAARLLRRLMPMTDAQWTKLNFSSIMEALFRYQDKAVLQPRDNAVAIVALLRALTATNRADGLLTGPADILNVLRWFAALADGSDAELRAETFLVLRNILVNCCEDHCETSFAATPSHLSLPPCWPATAARLSSKPRWSGALQLCSTW